MRRPAFTLLEVLLAAILSATLLMGLWSLFRVYSNLFVTGHDESLRHQLIRSLMEQFNADLQSTIQDPTAGPAAPPEGTSSVRRFSLTGTSRKLRIDILETSPVVAELSLDESQSDLPGTTPQSGEIEPETEFESESDSETELEPPRLPELRTVVYEFVEPATEEDPLLIETTLAETSDQEERPTGLIRRQYGWDAPDGTTPLAGDEELPEIETAQISAEDIDAVDLSAESPVLPLDEESETAATVLDDSLMVVPEVSSLEFRYHDGRSWNTSWDSVARKGLPLAVEVTFEITPPEKKGAGAAADSGEIESQPIAPAMDEEEEPDLLEEFAEQTGQIEVRDRHRLVIRLPASPFSQPPPQQLVPRSLASRAEAAPSRPARSIGAGRPRASRSSASSRARAADGQLRSLP